MFYDSEHTISHLIYYNEFGYAIQLVTSRRLIVYRPTSDSYVSVTLDAFKMFVIKSINDDDAMIQ